VNFLSKHVPAVMQFIREIKQKNKDVTPAEISDRLYKAVQPEMHRTFNKDVRGSVINGFLVVGIDIENPAVRSEDIYSNIDRLEVVNKDKPMIVKQLEALKQHLMMN